MICKILQILKRALESSESLESLESQSRGMEQNCSSKPVFSTHLRSRKLY